MSRWDPLENCIKTVGYQNTPWSNENRWYPSYANLFISMLSGLKNVLQVRIFSMMDDPVLDAICERLRQKIYIKGSKILYEGCVVEKMVFIVRGKIESIGYDGIGVPLSEGDVCGEELLTWCLEQSSVNKGMSLINNYLSICSRA